MPVTQRRIDAQTGILSGRHVNETRLRLALEASELGTWERNLATGEDLWSPQQEALFGLTSGSFSATHRAFLEMVHPDDRQPIEDAFQLALEGKSFYRSEYRIILPDGTLRWMAGRGDVIRDADGKPTYMVGVTIDITERKRVEDERARLLTAEQTARRAAENADQTKDAFLATVSHELRTPLTAILGWAQLLRTGTCTPEEMDRGLDTVERSARSMSHLVEDVLDVSRIITGKLRLRSEPVDLSAVIDAAVDTVRPAAQERNIRVGRLTGPHPGPVNGDAGRLQQVVWNLLVNAVKFSPDGGRVQVELDRVDSSAKIVVRDNGEGITAEFLPHLFERFTQADNTSRRSHSGLGLGLAIVYQLTELHGGTVSAHSDGPGKGSTFTVTLPLAEGSLEATSFAASNEAKSSAHPPRHDLDGVTVLFVDDAPDTRDFIAKVLADCGARVLTATSAAEAFAVIELSMPDVILSDIGMPGEDGYDLIRRIRTSEKSVGRQQIPAAAVTAFARSEDRDKAIAAGFQVHVAKPFDPVDLIGIVATLAGKSTGP